MSEGTQTINGAKSFTKLINRNAVYFSGASSTSIPNGAFTCPIYGTTFAISDPSGMYNSANARFTAQVSGLYQVHVFSRIQDQPLAANDTIGIVCIVMASRHRLSASVRPILQDVDVIMECG